MMGSCANVKVNPKGSRVVTLQKTKSELMKQKPLKQLPDRSQSQPVKAHGTALFTWLLYDTIWSGFCNCWHYKERPSRKRVKEKVEHQYKISKVIQKDYKERTGFYFAVDWFRKNFNLNLNNNNNLKTYWKRNNSFMSIPQSGRSIVPHTISDRKLPYKLHPLISFWRFPWNFFPKSLNYNQKGNPF